MNKLLIASFKKEVGEALDKVETLSNKLTEFKSATSDGGKKVTDDEIKKLVPFVVDSLIELMDILLLIKGLFNKKK